MSCPSSTRKFRTAIPTPTPRRRGQVAEATHTQESTCFRALLRRAAAWRCLKVGSQREARRACARSKDAVRRSRSTPPFRGTSSRIDLVLSGACNAPSASTIFCSRTGLPKARERRAASQATTPAQNSQSVETSKPCGDERGRTFHQPTAHAGTGPNRCARKSISARTRDESVRLGK